MKTPEEIVIQLRQEAMVEWPFGPGNPFLDRDRGAAIIRQAMADARAAERERCADCLDEMGLFAAAINLRSLKDQA